MKTVNRQLQDLTRTYVRESRRLWALDAIERNHGLLAKATQRRVNRQNWLAQIREFAEPLVADPGYWGDLAPGTPVVALICSSRDCDMCEGTTRRLVEAKVSAVERAMDRDFEWAEGPVRHWIQRPSDAFEAESRDRALEAFEDGHPHVIYG